MGRPVVRALTSLPSFLPVRTIHVSSRGLEPILLGDMSLAGFRLKAFAFALSPRAWRGCICLLKMVALTSCVAHYYVH